MFRGLMQCHVMQWFCLTLCPSPHGFVISPAEVLLNTYSVFHTHTVYYYLCFVFKWLLNAMSCHLRLAFGFCLTLCHSYHGLAIRPAEVLLKHLIIQTDPLVIVPQTWNKTEKTNRAFIPLPYMALAHNNENKQTFFMSINPNPCSKNRRLREHFLLSKSLVFSLLIY